MEIFEELKIKNKNNITAEIADKLKDYILTINNDKNHRCIPEFRLVADNKKITLENFEDECSFEYTELGELISHNKPIWDENHEIFMILDTLKTAEDICLSLWSRECNYLEWCEFFENNMTDELKNYISYKCMVIDHDYNQVYNYAYNKMYNGDVSLSAGREIVSDIDINEWYSPFVCISITPGEGDAFNENSPIVKALNETMDDWCIKHYFDQNVIEDNMIDMCGGQSFSTEANIESFISGLQQLLDIATAQGAEFTIDCADFCAVSLDVFASLQFRIENNRVVSKSCRF